MEKKIKSCDIFAHPVQIMFNGHGSFHSSTCGGIFSLCSIIVLFIYGGHLLSNFWTYDADKLQTIVQMQDFELLGDVKLGDMLITPQLVLTQFDKKSKNVKYLGLSDVEQYISIKAVH